MYSGLSPAAVCFIFFLPNQAFQPKSTGATLVVERLLWEKKGLSYPELSYLYLTYILSLLEQTWDFVLLGRNLL